jgi:hypothetical protein
MEPLDHLCWRSLATGVLLSPLAFGCGARSGLLLPGLSAEEAAPETDAGSPDLHSDDASLASDRRPPGVPPCSSYTTAESCVRGGCGACVTGLKNGSFVLVCIDPGGSASIEGHTCGGP